MKNSSSANGFVGEIEGLGLVDLVQFACLAGDERKLSVLSSDDNIGVLYFADKEIVHAQFGELTGEEAFFRIMSWPSGTFSMLFDKTDQRSIDSSWNFLLLEAARRIDEQQKKPESSPDRQETVLPKVLVVDDSRFFTNAFIKLFEEQIKAKVIGTATNGKEALKFLEMQTPDLVTLDMTMPVMSGDLALKHIMIRSPAPVLLLCNFSEANAFKMIEFMRYGAVDVVAKPTSPDSWDLISRRLQYILRNVGEFHFDNLSRAKNLKKTEQKITPSKPATKLVLILSGLGGMLELQKIIPALEADETAAVLVLQNMYPGMAKHLAGYFNSFTAYAVSVLARDEELLGGQCWIGNCHGRQQFIVRQGVPVLSGETDELLQKPLDTDNLIASAAKIFTSELVLIILSGVGMDLKHGMDAVREYGGRSILQEPSSSLLPGPLEELKTLCLEECCLKPEEIAPSLFKAWQA